ncbi:MAG: hypothetical protein WBP64_19790 [Nitrososphaeraceae archaeon]|jgi:hypothetical protein
MIAYNPPSQPDEVKIRLKHGDWEIEITCGKDRVKGVIEDVLFGIDNSTELNEAITSKLQELNGEIAYLKSRIMTFTGTQSQASSNTTNSKVVPSTGATCRGLIGVLCYEGYFESERSLGRVHEELSRRGYNYDRTAVSHSLTDMVREGSLRRVGTMRSYRYVQKGQQPNQQVI